MSTKTTFKRIALVAVATLSFGSLSVAPSSAANLPGFLTTSLNITKYTATPTIGAAVAFNLGGVFPTQTLGATTDSTNFTAALTAYPAGGYVGMTAATTTAAAGVVSAISVMPAAGISISGPTVIRTAATATNFVATTVTSSSTVGIGSYSFIPTKAGVYTLTVWNDNDVNGSITSLEARQTIDFTVVAASSLSTSLSTAFMAGPAVGETLVNSLTDVGFTSTTNAVAYSAAKGTGAATTKISQVQVILKNADGTVANGHTVTATISGSGLVKVDTTAATAPGDARSSTSGALGANIAYVHINTDGTSGTGTVTVSVTDVISGATTAIGTYTVNSFGSVTKLTATAIYTVGRAGGFTTGDPNGNRTTSAIIPAVIIKATDSLGNIVSGLTISALSSNTASVNSAIVINADTAGALFSSGGLGFYNASFSTTSFAKSGDVATLTFRILDPADPLGVAFLTAPVTVTVGGKIATETLSLDKTSYAPGEAMVVTRTAKDSAGNPVYDGAASPEVTFNKAVGGTSPGAGAYVGGVSATSATAPSVFAPVTGGAFLASMTSGNAASSVVTATATIAADTATSDIAQAAADAAAEATDAANAATDAANAAAEAADAATAAAQDAADAVAALSTQVAEQVNELKMQNDALRKQLVAITNLIIKIQKKVKA